MPISERDVNDAGEDPEAFIQKHGKQRWQQVMQTFGKVMHAAPDGTYTALSIQRLLDKEGR